MRRVALLATFAAILLAACNGDPVRPVQRTPHDRGPRADVAAASGAWTLLDLGTIGGGTQSRASAINATGQVVGFTETQAGSYFEHAFRWTRATGMQDLGTLPGGTWSEASGINAAGQVVGWSTPPEVGPNGLLGGHAFLWTQAGGMQDLGTLPGDHVSRAWAINASGTVVGAGYRDEWGP